MFMNSEIHCVMCCVCVLVCVCLTSFLSSVIWSRSWLMYCLESEWFSWPWISPSSFWKGHTEGHSHVVLQSIIHMQAYIHFNHSVDTHTHTHQPVSRVQRSSAWVQPWQPYCLLLSAARPSPPLYSAWMGDIKQLLKRRAVWLMVLDRLSEWCIIKCLHCDLHFIYTFLDMNPMVFIQTLHISRPSFLKNVSLLFSVNHYRLFISLCFH